MSWHFLELEKVFEQVKSNKEGLTETEAKIRLAKNGLNALPKEKPYSKLKLLFSQFNSPLVIIFLVAGGISLYLEHYSDAIFIIVVLLINTLVGFYQENKANTSLAALRNMVTISARVFRDANLKQVDSKFLVAGDMILLRAGDKIPADARLVTVQGLKVNEASLTGEWMATHKNISPVAEKSLLGDRSDMVFMGSMVEEGTGTAVVVEVGLKTEIGKIVSLLRETKERKTPLQQKITKLSHLVGAFVMGVITLVVIIGYLNGESFQEIFIAALALAVSAVPAGLLPAITVVLALGMRRILKHNGLVRKLIANETLGSVTVICTDKTGTLTEGKMNVSHILTGSQELLSDNRNPIMEVKHTNGVESHIMALKVAVLTNDAFIENPDDEFHQWVVRGSATSRALLVAGTHAGLSKKKLEADYPVIEKIAFSSEAKYSASLHNTYDQKKILYVIGAPEVISARSTDFYMDGKKEDLGSVAHQQLLKKLETLTSSGLRVIACAYRDFSKKDDQNLSDASVQDLTLIGYIALKDPLRADAKSSIALTERAGIRTVLITGDHHLTAQAIAAEVGIKAEPDMILEGQELDKLSDDELKEKVKNIAIYSRVSPGHKLKIVKALQARGEVVAMLGDGVNDAPALKVADVGVAVGSGTDVAKEVADVVLLDDNFGTVVKAIEQGRIIFQNIRKVFVYLIADDFSELFLFLAAMLLGLPLPLLAAQILWINLVEDGLPDIALTTEQETEGVMDEPPRDPKESILNKPMKKWLLSIFFITGSAAFLLFLTLWNTTGDLDKTRTIVFALMCLDSLIFAFCVRSFHRPIFRKDIFSNRLLVGAVGIGLLLLVSAIYFAPFQKLLSTQPMAINEWLLILAISMVEIVIIEFFKKKSFNLKPALA